MAKEWDEMTADEKSEHLFHALQSVVSQQNNVNAKLQRQVQDLEAKVARLSKG